MNDTAEVILWGTRIGIDPAEVAEQVGIKEKTTKYVCPIIAANMVEI